jgi:ABC-2 type transport system ATP-binding protein
MANPIAELRSVTKTYGKMAALAEVSMTVSPGEIVALLGPNGAGKTTALNLMMGLRKPSAGKVRLFGKDPRKADARTKIGVTPQETALPENLKIREIVDFVRAHYPSPATTAEILERFELGELKNRQAGGLSGGQKRRICVALAFAGRPKVIFLDEPTTGLDPASRRSLWKTAKSYVEDGGTLVLTTHYLEEAEALASRIILIDQAKVVRVGSVDEIKSSVGVRIVRFKASQAPNLPTAVKQETKQTEQGLIHTYYCQDADAAVRILVESSTEFEDLEVLPVTLEEAVYISPDNLT